MINTSAPTDVRVYLVHIKFGYIRIPIRVKHMIHIHRYALYHVQAQSAVARSAVSANIMLSVCVQWCLKP